MLWLAPPNTKYLRFGPSDAMRLRRRYSVSRFKSM